MIPLLLISIATQPNMPNIVVPYQALPAFTAYSSCYSDRFRADTRTGSANIEEVRQAHRDALSVCREVRAEQLARGLAAVGDERTPLDTRTYRNRAEAQAAVRRAFDRFDTDVEIEQGQQC